MRERRASGPLTAGERPRAADRELDRLLGIIRRRRLERLARERALGVESPAGRAPDGLRALAPSSGASGADAAAFRASRAASGASVEASGADAAAFRASRAASGASVGAPRASVAAPRASVAAPRASVAAPRASVAAPRANTARAAAPVEGGTLLDIRAVGPDVRILRIARPPGFTFEAGQALALSLPGARVRRSYSIASAPHEDHLELCIELIPGGRLSALLGELAPGARLEISPRAKGSFRLQRGKARHLMVATVTGIAPLRSMLRDVLSKPDATSEFFILHGASHVDDLPYADEMRELSERDARVHYLPTVSRPGAPRNRSWSQRIGRVETHVLPTLQALGARATIGVYACGHPEMVSNVQHLLAPLGYDVSAEDFG